MESSNNIDEKIIQVKQQQEEVINKRQYYNNLILDKIKEAIDNNTQFRFQQILWLLNITDNTDRFYEESKNTYNRINIALDRQRKMKEKISEV